MIIKTKYEPHKNIVPSHKEWIYIDGVEEIRVMYKTPEAIKSPEAGLYDRYFISKDGDKNKPSEYLVIYARVHGKLKTYIFENDCYLMNGDGKTIEVLRGERV